MKKFFFLVLFVSLFFISACTDGKIQSLEEFYKDEEIENVDKIIIQDGSTGASKIITNQKQVNEFISLIKDIEYTPQKNQKKRDGWRYGITLFDGKKEFKFTLNEIGNIYYHTNPDIHPIVENYFQQYLEDH